MTTEPDVEIGKIVNHTHRLDIGEIRQIVKERVLAQLGLGVVDKIEPVHAAPADDNKLLTKAARAWRQAPGEEMEFTEEFGHKMFWFGVRYTLKGPDQDEDPDDEVPTQWPPEGEEVAEDADAPDPRIAEQLGVDEDEG